MEDLWNAVGALAPTVLVGLVFWLVMFVIIRADKHERRAYAAIDAEERAKLVSASSTASTSPTSASPASISHVASEVSATTPRI